MKLVKRPDEMNKEEISFWQSYCERLIEKGLVGKQGSYMTKRDLQFAYGLNGRRLKEVTAPDVKAWVDELGRSELFFATHFEGLILRTVRQTVWVQLSRGDESGRRA